MKNCANKYIYIFEHYRGIEIPTFGDITFKSPFIL